MEDRSGEVRVGCISFGLVLGCFRVDLAFFPGGPNQGLTSQLATASSMSKVSLIQIPKRSSWDSGAGCGWLK